MFPRRRELKIIGTKSSDDEHDDLTTIVLNTDKDIGETFKSFSSSGSENQTKLDVDVGDFVIAKTHALQCRDHPKHL